MFISMEKQEKKIKKINLSSWPWPCVSADGGAMMSRMDSEFPAIWNRGFEIIKKSGRFAQICREADNDHGNVVQIYTYIHIKAKQNDTLFPVTLFI